MIETTIPVTPIRVRLRVGSRRGRTMHQAADIILRWLQRHARRRELRVNKPSLVVESDHDPSTRTSYLYGFVDTFPDTAPAWLEDADVPSKEFWIESPHRRP